MVQVAQVHEPILEALERGDGKRAGSSCGDIRWDLPPRWELPRQESVQYPETGGFAAYWGEVTTSSSDGQQFRAGGRAGRVKRTGDPNQRPHAE